MELLTSMDLRQHVTLLTHQAGGTLDLVITFRRRRRRRRFICQMNHM